MHVGLIGGPTVTIGLIVSVSGCLPLNLNNGLLFSLKDINVGLCGSPVLLGD